MRDPDDIVFLVDDDPSFRRSAERLLDLAGYQVESFSSAQEFMGHSQPDVAACMITDLRMPGMNGLDFQHELAAAGWQIPIIFVTGHGDVPTSVRAMKSGASEFLTKPFPEKDFLSAVAEALKKDRARREGEAGLAELRQRYRILTAREREILKHIVAGLLNKEIAARLNISEKTVKFHRAHLMNKMLAGSLSALVQMAIQLELNK